MKRFTSITILTIVFLVAGCNSMINYNGERDDMINRLKWQGVNSQRVLKVMSGIPRHNFVLPKYKREAYSDKELPIGYGQTINRPIEDALILMALNPKPTDKVLEVGTGSGYQTALIAKMAGEVYSIEIVPELAREAKVRLLNMKIENAYIRAGDGFFGWPGKSPFDLIFASCSPAKIPQPLIDQLTEGGKILVPLGGEKKFQQWILYQKKNGKLRKINDLTIGQFVPMEGEAKH